MRNIGTLPRLDALVLRTLEYRDSRRGPDALRQIADAAARDPWGRVVQVLVSTDAEDAPADCAGGG
jgi:hypothetical protein